MLSGDKDVIEAEVDYGPGRLIDHIRSLPGFEIQTQIDGNYGHVGATLADVVLQSNNHYERNVRRRVARIRLDYGGHVNLTDLQQLLWTISPQEFLDWKGTRKPQIFLDLVGLLAREDVDTEDDMRSWLLLDNTRDKLLAVRFIGPKTADYLKILVGLPVAAMDRHLFGFLAEAGLGDRHYSSAQTVIHRAADLMGVSRSHLDHSIWRYMSGRSKPPRLLSGPSGCHPRSHRRHRFPCRR